MKRNAAALAAVGAALYGPAYQGALSEALGVSTRTMRRWINDGDYSIPEGVWPDLAKLCQDQSGLLHDWYEKLR